MGGYIIGQLHNLHLLRCGLFIHRAPVMECNTVNSLAGVKRFIVEA